MVQALSLHVEIGNGMWNSQTGQAYDPSWRSSIGSRNACKRIEHIVRIRQHSLGVLACLILAPPNRINLSMVRTAMANCQMRVWIRIAAHELARSVECPETLATLDVQRAEVALEILGAIHGITLEVHLVICEEESPCGK